MERLTGEFFARDGLRVARELLGKTLVHETAQGPVRGLITEVESYMGADDKGSHTYGGRRTERTEPMFAKGGTSYVYFTYGMYHCMNISSGEEGDPQAVLIRSVIPADRESEERMRMARVQAALKKASGRTDAPFTEEERRKRELQVEKHLADGPGKLCIAMGITRADNNVDMTVSPFFYVTEGICVEEHQIRAGKRIGIDYAQEAAEYLWRFYL